MTRLPRTWFGLFLSVLVAFFVAPLGCSANGLIGGECGADFAFCDGQCKSIVDDETNCGRCDNACPRNLACVDALCGGPDGTIPLPGTGGEGTGGAGSGTGGIGFGGINTGAGGPGGNDGVGGTATGGNTGVGGTGGGAPCLAPYNTADKCGDCATQCSGATPNCAPDGGGSFECVASCLIDPYLTQCGTVCVDPDTDARHCGTCDNRCDSGICTGGVCVGAVSGHMVALCMSYESASPSQTNLLGNSVFLASGNPVRILAYVRDTSAGSLAGSNQALLQAAVAKGRSFEKTEVTGLNSVTNELNRSDYEVLIIYDQENAPTGRLASRGAAWAPVVQTFTEAGGVVVVLTGGGGISEMHELIDGLNMFSSTGTINYDGRNYNVIAPGDAVGINVISPFLAVATSCVFEGAPSGSGDLVHVTSGAGAGAGSGEPGVVHRIIPP